ncbi:MAG: right-handed parallel beta-helix repeat-containing protein [Pseudonocardiaceae bacterium]
MVSRAIRVVSVSLVMLVGLVGLTTGCSSARHSPSTGQGASDGQDNSPEQPKQGLPSTCTHTITRGGDAPTALEAASPGDTLCFSGGDLTDTSLSMIRSGTAAAPIRLVSDGGTVHEVQIKGDHVIVEGFTVAGGGGILLEGAGITARNNTVHDTQQGGITCHPCTDSTIESNTMRHAATNGIDITGQRITVHANTISDTVPVQGGDADGVRFYGNGHRITDNTIFDISAEGYSSPPHPDCFQTFDQHRPPTFDVIISGNTCRNVDAQCLIATGDQGSNRGAPADVPSITFEGNKCANNGAQAVNLRRWARVQVLNNTFSGPNLTRAVLIIDGSTDAAVVGNDTSQGRPTVDIDRSSRPGSRVEGNSPA